MASCYNEETLEHSFVNGENVEFTDAELVTLFQMRGNDHKIDVGEATKFANDVIGFLDTDVATKAASPRKISSIAVLTAEDMQKVVTRVSDGETIEIPDTIAYLFNFGDNSGYAIVSGDKRIDAPILGYCDSGSLTDGLNNPGLIGIMVDMENYIVASISKYENRIDSITNEILNKIVGDSAITKMVTDRKDFLQSYELYVREIDGYAPSTPTTTTTTSTTVGNWVTTDQVQPLLPVEWNQGFPFNYRVKNKNGCTNAPAGCVAVALAHLLAYWQYPASVGNTTFNWPLIESYTARPNAYPNVFNKKKFNISESQYSNSNTFSADEKNFVSQVSTLLEFIGSCVAMKYTNNGSSASNDMAMRFLYTFGYNTDPNTYNGTYVMNYDYNKVIQSLNSKCPVYASGESKKIKHRIKILGITVGTWSEYGEGHAWVIDGYLNRRKATTVQVTVKNRSTGVIVSQTSTTTNSYANYLHHNWGWEGENGYYYNGYIVAGSYDSQDPDRLDSNTRATVTYDEGNYQFLKEICPNLRPR